MHLIVLGNDLLRVAVRENLVSFPSQIPSFTQRGDMRERIVQLYFVRGWDVKAICHRFDLSRSTVRKLLSDWKARAIGAGYIQEIDPEGLAVLAAEGRLREPEEPPRIRAGGSKRDYGAYWGTGLPVYSEYLTSEAAFPGRGL